MLVYSWVGSSILEGLQLVTLQGHSVQGCLTCRRHGCGCGSLRDSEEESSSLVDSVLFPGR